MPLKPLIRQRIKQLQSSAIDWQPGTASLARPSGSDHFELLKGRVGDAGLERMFERGRWVKTKLDPFGDGAHPDAPRPEKLLRIRAEQGKYSKTKVKPGIDKNYYDPKANEIALIDPNRVPYAAHEMRHAYDHLHRKLDLGAPEQRLKAEVNAYGSQLQTARELGQDAGLSGRTAQQQARTYEGKPGYPGTLESSERAVDDWRKKR